MNRNLYIVGIFFLALNFAVALFQSITYIQLGPQTFTLQSFVSWFVTMSSISIVTTLILLKYFHYKGFWLAFSGGIIVAITSLGRFYVLYNLLTVRGLESYYAPVSFIDMGAGILYSIILIFSNAGKRLWLRVAGGLTFVVGLLFMITLIWSLKVAVPQVNGSLDIISRWISFLGAFVLVPYILNFLTELKTVNENKAHAKLRNYLAGLLLVMGLGALVATLYMGPKIANERNGLLKWNNRGPENAQRLAEPFEARIYVGNRGDTLKYRLLRPINYDSTKKYPLVVCLHGGGGWGTDNIKQVEGSWTAQMLSKYYNMEKYHAFLFVPQCPPMHSWGGGIPNYPGIDFLVFETMGKLEKQYNIDENRRYVMGESLGGYGTWSLICKKPNMFAAAVPICGKGDPELASRIVDVPMWAFHGAKDRNVPVSGSRDMIEAIREAGGNPRYSEFPDAGHIISEQFYSTPDLLDWVFEQKRGEQFRTYAEDNSEKK